MSRLLSSWPSNKSTGRASPSKFLDEAADDEAEEQGGAAYQPMSEIDAMKLEVRLRKRTSVLGIEGGCRQDWMNRTEG